MLQISIVFSQNKLIIAKVIPRDDYLASHFRQEISGAERTSLIMIRTKQFKLRLTRHKTRH